MKPVPSSTVISGDIPRPSRISRLLVLVGVLAILVQGGMLAGRWWRDRQPVPAAGTKAVRTVVTPVALRVMDPVATESLRQEAGEKLAPLYRFDSRSADAQVQGFLGEYEKCREQFLKAIERLGPLPLDRETLASTRFADVLATFQSAQTVFPLTAVLAENWAAGLEREPIFNETATVIRQALHGYVVPKVGTGRPLDGHDEVWLSVLPEQGGVNAPDEFPGAAKQIHRRSMIPLAEARAQVRAELAAHGEAWTGFAEGFVVPNVGVDDDYTAAAREHATRDLMVWVDFAAGDELVQRGAELLPAQWAALVELRRRAATSEPLAWSSWVLAALGALFLALGALMRRSVAVTPEPGTMVLKDSQAAVRAGVIQQLTGWLKSAFTQRLVAQRNDALAGQEEASGKLGLMEERLSRLQPEIRERIATYQKRIAALELELKDAGDVNCELIRTRIMMARKELEIEKARSNLVWN